MRSLHTTTKSSPRSLELEKAREQQQRPNTAKNKYIFKKKKINKDLLHSTRNSTQYSVMIYMGKES